MAAELVAVVSLALTCAGWVALQRWISHRDPGNPGVDRGCDGRCGSCTGHCRE